MSDRHRLPRNSTPIWQQIGVLLLGVLLAGCGHGGAKPTTNAGVAGAGMRSFRYVLDATASGVLGTATAGGTDPTINFHVAGDVPAPRRDHVATKMSLGGTNAVTLERVRIDGQTWVRSADGPWSTTTNTIAGTGGIWLEGDALLGADANARLRSTLNGLASTPERLGNTDALRYTVHAAELRTILGLATDASSTTLGHIDGDSTLWVTKDGMLPARVVTDATPNTGGKVHLELNFTDQNASNIVVNPPA